MDQTRNRLVLLSILSAAACSQEPVSGPPAADASLIGTAAAQVFTVNTADDVDDGVCDPSHCSLREAIIAGNRRFGADVIYFAIPGTGPHTIQPLAALPRVTDPVIIDAYSQPGASPNTNPETLGTNALLQIELNGISAGLAATGLDIFGGGSTVRGFVINRFARGILISGQGGNVIEGNFVGTDHTGRVALGNRFRGIDVSGLSNDNLIGGTTAGARNLISGNGFGVNLSRTTGTRIQGNLVGTDATGKSSLRNTDGILMVGFASGNVIGGATPGARNIISGNLFAGIEMSSTSNGNVVEGNFIGTDVSGTVGLGNSVGIAVSGSGQTIANNVISGNKGAGSLRGSGIDMLGFPVPSTFGNVIRGNLIGTDVSGTSPIGNAGDGVLIRATGNPPTDNTIGGFSSSDANTIAFNGRAGVSVGVGVGNSVLRNSLHSNAGIGIDLSGTQANPSSPGDGITPNDFGDTDDGANGLQNFPVLGGASSGPSSTIIDGTLNSAANTVFRLEFFTSNECDPSGHGEGETFLDWQGIQTDASGDANFVLTLAAAIPIGSSVTATATDPAENTSEFSQCVTVTSMSPEALVQGLIDQVGALVQTGDLNRGQGNALIVKLGHALERIADGRSRAAINVLRAFINQVEAFISSGTLTASEGPALIDQAHWAIDQLES